MASAYKADTTVFRDHLSEEIFNNKYRHEGCETWPDLSNTLVDDVCSGLLDKTDIDTLKWMISTMRFIPGGRYLYYAGRPRKFFNNCFLLGCTEDTREQWAKTAHDATMCLMTGGGIGVDYSILRGAGASLKGTGGVASGPIDLMKAVNNIGRTVIQGGSRRSAIYASLSCDHSDIETFLKVKDWHEQPINGSGITVAQAKAADFNYDAPLDMTNISVNWNTKWLQNFWETGDLSETWIANVRQALRTGEPGFSFNFFNQENETLRNACTEVTSDLEDDGDVCNLGSLNMARIENIKEFALCTELATKFLLAGTVRAELPFAKVYEIREKNRRLGLGLMGIHEFLLQRNSKYEVTPELRQWLHIYKNVSDQAAFRGANDLSVSQPVARRAIAPTGSIAVVASTTSGIEPLYAVAYKRRFLKNKTWTYQYHIDAAAQNVIGRYGVSPDKIETSADLAKDYERRIAFQADIQDFVDMSISSTINLPEWGSAGNNEDTVLPFAKTLAKYAHRLRGFTCYPTGSRGGQPLNEVPYAEAKKNLGKNFEEGMEANDICEITGQGGTCNG